MEAGKAKGIVRCKSRRNGGERLVRLLDGHHSGNNLQRCAECGFGYGDDGVPVLRLQPRQLFRRLGPVAKKIAACIRRDLGGDGFAGIVDSIDGRIRKVRQRHPRWIDHLFLRPPLLGDRLGQRPRRHL